jgi:hypothetical protein
VRLFWVWILTSGILFAPVDPRELVRQSIRNGKASWVESFDYYCVEREVDRQFDSAGLAKSTETDVYNIVPLGDHTSFAEEVEHDGEPLPSVERKRIERELQHLRSETPAQKHHRFEKDLADRSYMEEIPDAFDFKITGEENLPTGPAWVISATPRPGYEPMSRYGHMFPKMHGTLWIDEKDGQWVKADAVATEPVTFGVFLARLSKGSHITLEQRKLPDGAWVPQRLEARAEARTFLFFNHNFEEDITYSDYHKMPALTASAKR